jgi:hypothetical protein
MARVKQYNEQVIEKRCLCSGAMGMSTSVRMLEEMGINQFSIYAGFGVNGVFLESLKCYKEKPHRFSKNYKTEQRRQ